MCLGCSQERLHAICAPTLAEAAAGLRAHGQTGYLLRVLPSGERTAIRQAGTRRGVWAQNPDVHRGFRVISTAEEPNSMSRFVVEEALRRVEWIRSLPLRCRDPA